MIKDKFRNAIDQHPDRLFLISPSGVWTYAEFYQYICQVAQTLDQLAPGRIACHLPDSPRLIGLMFATDLCGRSLVLFNHDYSPQQIEPLLQQADAAVLITDNAEISCPGCQILSPGTLDKPPQEAGSTKPPQPPGQSEILILTSGTTGQAKCARYSWSRLFAQVSGNLATADERWLLAYRLNHFAGVQMLIHVLNNCSTLVLPRSNRVADAIKAMTEHHVTHVSSTPTFWRYALTLLQDNRDRISLQHITLGSEAASADLLDKLHTLFPTARIVQIYASTEAGSCISISDMQPGLPLSVLSRPESAAVRFRIVEGELYIRSTNGMSGYLGTGTDTNAEDIQWRASGDLVRVENDRIFFVGRKNETINVGGVKVHPLDVENIISPLDGVKVVKAYGLANPIVGQIVAVDVVCHETAEATEVEAEIRQACKALPRASRPRSINFVDTILTNNYKLSRR